MIRAAAEPLAAEVIRLTEELDIARLKYEQNDGMDGAVVHAIRQMLYDQGIPKASFIDDHVGNALMDRISYRAERDAAVAANAALMVRMGEARETLNLGVALVDQDNMENLAGWDAFNVAARAWLAGE